MNAVEKTAFVMGAQAASQGKSLDSMVEFYEWVEGLKNNIIGLKINDLDIFWIDGYNYWKKLEENKK